MAAESPSSAGAGDPAATPDGLRSHSKRTVIGAPSGERDSSEPRSRISIPLQQRDRLLGYLLLLPALIVLALIVGYPLVHTFVTSLTDAALGRPTAWVGLRNYQSLLTTPDFWASLARTWAITITAVVGQVVIGLLVAVSLDAISRFQQVFRTIFVIPWALPTFVAAVAVSWVLHGQFGLVNIFLRDLGLIEVGTPWLGQPVTALWAVSASFIWKGLPWSVLIILAGLQAVPRDFYEAAAVDGASRWQAFLHITLPSIRFVLIVVIILRTIWTFNNFDFVWLLTGGGPLNATRTLAIDIYRTAFIGFRMGEATALGFLMFIVLIPLFIFLNRLNKGAEEEHAL